MASEERPSGLQGAELLAHHLRRLGELRRREDEPGTAQRRYRLAAWQSARLARTHHDLLQSPRFGAAVRFFLSDLYAPRDFTQRYRDLQRIAPLLVRTLPREVIQTLALAVEMNVLTLDLDESLLGELGAALDGELDDQLWAAAIRRCEDRAQRLRQIDLIRRVGEDLDRIVSKPGVYFALRLGRQPARLAGLGDLQEFLVRGFEAFRKIRGSELFLDAITGRESEILRRIWARHPRPLELVEGS